MFSKPSFSFILAFALLNLVSGCSTYIEDRASEAFEPVFPTVSLAPDTTRKTGAIYRAGEGGLFSKDRRARKVGDILTVDFNEVFSATKAQTAASAKSDSFELSLPLGLPNVLTGGLANGEPDNALTTSTAQAFSGSGNAAQSNSLTGRLSVTVVRVFDNGNLGILGQKELTLNNGKEYIRVSGIVRQEDISSVNTVPSNRLADAQISYIGAGDMADSSKKGWLSRAMRTISPF
jgi:flagellar L-ring protein precursor FlgH